MRTLDSRTAAMLDLEPQMTPDWNAIRLDLLQVDEPMRAALREMRPFFAKSLPGILARYYDKVRHYDPSSGIFKNGAMQEAIRMQLQHRELIAACNFGPDYLASATRFCELNQRTEVAPQWYVGGRQMFIADQLMRAADDEIAIPRFGRAAQAARDRKALMLNAIAKAMMMDTQNIIAAYFGSNRQLRKDAIAAASDRFRINHHFVVDGVERAGSHRTLAERQRRQHHAACDRGRQCLGGRLQQRAIGGIGDRRTRQFGARDFGAGSGIQPHRRQRRATGG